MSDQLGQDYGRMIAEAKAQSGNFGRNLQARRRHRILVFTFLICLRANCTPVTSMLWKTVSR